MTSTSFLLTKKYSTDDLTFIEKKILQTNSFSSAKLYNIKDFFDSELEKEKRKLFLELIKKHSGYEIFFIRKDIVIKTNDDGEYNRFNFKTDLDHEKKIIWIRPKFWFKEQNRIKQN